jgi:hypothetical protein
MLRKIPPATILENLRKEAKRWLKAVRAGDEEPAHAWAARGRKRRQDRACGG